MNKIYFQGTFGAYSHLAALSIFKDAEIWLCPGQWSFPINLPLDFLGIPSKRSRILFEEGTPHTNALNGLH